MTKVYIYNERHYSQKSFDTLVVPFNVVRGRLSVGNDLFLEGQNVLPISVGSTRLTSRYMKRAGWYPSCL